MTKIKHHIGFPSPQCARGDQTLVWVKYGLLCPTVSNQFEQRLQEQGDGRKHLQSVNEQPTFHSDNVVPLSKSCCIQQQFDSLCQHTHFHVVASTVYGAFSSTDRKTHQENSGAWLQDCDGP